MYESFYGLRDKPFSILPDPDLIYWSRLHRMAYAMLQYGVINHAAFTVITGEIGSGKTTLVRHLLRRFENSMTAGLISNTPQEPNELLRWIMLAFNQPTDGDYLSVFKRFQEFVMRQAKDQRWTILIIDEAQNLGVQALEELRMLSNINTDNRQILQLILVGQPQLRELLRDPRLVQFSQRVAVDFHVSRLDQAEVTNYISYRVQAVGGRADIFNDAACKLIAKASRGIPRVINILCDRALVYGFSAGAQQIPAELIAQVLADNKTYGIFPLETDATGRT